MFPMHQSPQLPQKTFPTKNFKKNTLKPPGLPHILHIAKARQVESQNINCILHILLFQLKSEKNTSLMGDIIIESSFK